MGLNWARSSINPLVIACIKPRLLQVALLYMTVFCGISPVGVGVGMAIKEVGPSVPLCSHPQAGEGHGSDTLVIFQGLATGSLLYVVFFEIMEKERAKVVSGLLQVCTTSDSLTG